MYGTMTKYAITAGIAAVIASAIPPAATASPFAAGKATVKEAAPSDVIDVRRHWRRGALVAGAAAAGFFAGAAIASRRHYAYPYGPYAYDPYPYGPYATAPGHYYYAPGPARCWVQVDERGFGYWDRC